MLDIKVIRENLDWSKKKLATRGIKPEELDELVEIDTKRRKDLTKSEQLKAKRNDVSKQIAEKKRNKEDASDAIAAMREVGKEIKDLYSPTFLAWSLATFCPLSQNSTSLGAN